MTPDSKCPKDIDARRCARLVHALLFQAIADWLDPRSHARDKRSSLAWLHGDDCAYWCHLIGLRHYAFLSRANRLQQASKERRPAHCESMYDFLRSLMVEELLEDNETAEHISIVLGVGVPLVLSIAKKVGVEVAREEKPTWGLHIGPESLPEEIRTTPHQWVAGRRAF